MINIKGDRNCLYRSISRFVYGTENLHLRVRNEIYLEALNRINEYPDIALETENRPMPIRQNRKPPETPKTQKKT